MKVQFADCVLDVDARTVCRETAAIHLSPKAFELLAALIEHRGRALSKTELLERVWPDVFVSDGSLARVVKEIREALGDSRMTPASSAPCTGTATRSLRSSSAALRPASPSLIVSVRPVG